MLIYSFEGKTFEFVKLIIEKNSLMASRNLMSELIKLGEYTALDNIKVNKDFFYFELNLNLDKINCEELNTYIKNIYSKGHLEILQCHYVKAKLEKVDKATINKLVVVNPYTLGLKKLMLAFIEEDINEAIKLYNEAIKNLRHIKYYYIEAIYYFSKFLKENNLSEYSDWVEKGYNLAKKYYYRFLWHQFECLINDKFEPYDQSKYELPEKLDFDSFIKKYLEHEKKRVQKR
jgi:hypothetical protein